MDFSIAEQLTVAPGDGEGDRGDRMVCRNQDSHIQVLHLERGSSGVACVASVTAWWRFV